MSAMDEIMRTMTPTMVTVPRYGLKVETIRRKVPGLDFRSGTSGGVSRCGHGKLVPLYDVQLQHYKRNLRWSYSPTHARRVGAPGRTSGARPWRRRVPSGAQP